MDNYFSVTFKDEYIQVESNGEKNLEFATKLWSRIVHTCEKHQCFTIFGIADTVSPVSLLEAVYHVDLFEQLNITSKYRIAWIEMNPQHVATARLIENYLSSRKLNCKLFTDVQEAEKWLFYGKIPDNVLKYGEGSPL